MISALAVVLGLMIGAAWCLKKIGARTGMGIPDGQLIRVVSSSYIGPKNSIVIVDVLGELLVVGISGTRMTLLTSISDAGRIDRMREMKDITPPVSLVDAILRCREKIKNAGSGKGSR
jgi:flagellar protein FliO/FliZ